MNDYQKEQLDALMKVRQGLNRMSKADRSALVARAKDYIAFRKSVDDFLHHHFGKICIETCYQSHISACCSKDGIITFFADTVINALFSAPSQLDDLEAMLRKVNQGHRCVYLRPDGCAWAVRPVVCAMFLCDRAMSQVFKENCDAKRRWESFRREEMRFKWPDRPVLFDQLETVFLAMGYRSTLMHLNFSPGLLSVKKKAGLISGPRR